MNESWCNSNLKGSYIGNAIELTESFFKYLKNDTNKTSTVKGSETQENNFYQYIEKNFFEKHGLANKGSTNTDSQKQTLADILTDKDFDRDGDLRKLKILSLLQLFNNLAISILKAEYSLFDNYSYNLNQLSEFYEIEKNKSGKIIEAAGGNESEKLDHYLIKSILKIFYHIISMCKIIDTKVDYKLINKNISLINTDFETRINSIYPHPPYKIKFLDKGIIDFFEQTLISVIDMTLIDHCYYLNPENINTLVQCFDRITEFKEFIDKNIPRNIPNRNETRTHFNSIVKIVQYKSAVLLQQMVDCYNKESDKNGNKKDFYSDFHFIISGTKLETMELDEFFGRKLELNRYNYPLDKNFNTEYLSPIIKSYTKKFSNYNEIKQEVDLFLDKEKSFYKKEAANKTHQDIVTFNETSKLSIKLYTKIYEIITANTTKEKIEKIKEFRSPKKPDPEFHGVDMYRLNPSAYSRFISILCEYLDEVLKDDHKEKSEIENIYELFGVIMRDYNEFIQNKKHFTVGELRFFPPFQYCYYKLLGNNTISYYPITKEKLPYVTEDDEPDYAKFKDEKVDFFFFMSLCRTPLNLGSLEDRLLDYQTKHIKIRESYRLFNSKKQLKEIVDENEKKFDDQHKNHITVLGILGAFIALASGAVSNWLTASNIFQFVFMEIGFIIALSCFVFLVRFRIKKGWTNFGFTLLYIILFFIFIGFLCGINYWIHDKYQEKLLESKPQKAPISQNNIHQDNNKNNTYSLNQ